MGAGTRRINGFYLSKRAPFITASPDADDEAAEEQDEAATENEDQATQFAHKLEAQANQKDDAEEEIAKERDGSIERIRYDITDFDRDELVATIREVFSTGETLDRDTAIRETAHTLGFQRTGPRIYEEIKLALRLAKRRGIITENGDGFVINCRHIGDYSRDELITILVGTMGSVWWEREDAIRAATRSLGFRRTGRAIRDAFKSATNGAIRRGLIEYQGMWIRNE